MNVFFFFFFLSTRVESSRVSFCKLEKFNCMYMNEDVHRYELSGIITDPDESRCFLSSSHHITYFAGFQRCRKQEFHLKIRTNQRIICQITDVVTESK